MTQKVSFLSRFAGARAVGLLALASLLAAGTAFVVNLISARVLGPESRGEVALVLQLAYLIGPVVGLGVDRARLRSSGRPDDTSQLIGGRLGGIQVAIFFIPLVVVVFGPWAALCVPIALVTASFQIHRSNALAFGRYRRYFVLFSAYQLSILSVTISLALIGVSSWQLWATAYLVPGVLVMVFRWQPEGESRTFIRAIRYNWPFMGAAVSQMLVARGERVLLAGLVGSYDLGLYVVIATATEPLYWVSQAIADRRTSSARLNTVEPSRVIVFLRDCLVFSSAGALGGIALFYLVVPLFGEDYAPARELVIPLAVASVGLALYRQAAGRALLVSGEKTLGITEGLLGGVAIGVYWLAIELFGIMGAAWGSIVMYAIATATLSFISAKVVRSHA